MKKKFLSLLLALQIIAFEAKADTVVAVHGFLTNWRSIKPIKHLLGSVGLDVCFWEYPSRRYFLQQHGANLAATLQSIACNCPGAPIHFLTHSIGGLVLRAALNHPNCPQEAKIGRAVLLAPPNQGSSLAHKVNSTTPIAFALGEKSGWQLMHYDACQIVETVGEFPPTLSVLVIAGTKGNKMFFSTPNDGMVTVDETRLNTPSHFLALPFTHSELLTERSSLEIARDFISCGTIP